MKRNFPDDANPSGGSPPNKLRRLASLVPHKSFANVLVEMDELHHNFARPSLRLRDNKKSITFQQLDVQELANHSGDSSILIFGLTEAGNTICVRVNGFLNSFYHPIKSGYPEGFLDNLRQDLNEKLLGSYIKRINQIKMPQIKGSTPSPYAEFLVASSAASQKVAGLGAYTFQDLTLYPTRFIRKDVDYVSGFTANSGLYGMKWIEILGEKYSVVADSNRVSTCQIEVRYSTRQRVIQAAQPPTTVAPLRILSFDIETMIPSNFSFPHPDKEPCIQIASMLTNHGETEPFYRSVMTLKSCNKIEGADVSTYEDEASLLKAWISFLQKADPDVVTGYNTSRFDLQYILLRARKLGVPCNIGRLADSRMETLKFDYQQKKWDTVPCIPGVLNFDMLRYMFQECPLKPEEGKIQNPFTLGSSSLRFLNENKEDVEYKLIPQLQAGTDEDRTRLAVYCLKDAYLPQRLLDKLDALNKWVKKAQEYPVPFNVSFLRDPRFLQRMQLIHQSKLEGYLGD